VPEESGVVGAGVLGLGLGNCITTERVLTGIVDKAKNLLLGHPLEGLTMAFAEVIHCIGPDPIAGLVQVVRMHASLRDKLMHVIPAIRGINTDLFLRTLAVLAMATRLVLSRLKDPAVIHDLGCKGTPLLGLPPCACVPVPVLDFLLQRQLVPFNIDGPGCLPIIGRPGSS